MEKFEIKVHATMKEKKKHNLTSVRIADRVSDETSEVFALFTGLIGSLRDCNKIFDINGRRFKVRVDSAGTVKVTPIKKTE